MKIIVPENQMGIAPIKSLSFPYIFLFNNTYIFSCLRVSNGHLTQFAFSARARNHRHRHRIPTHHAGYIRGLFYDMCTESSILQRPCGPADTKEHMIALP